MRAMRLHRARSPLVLDEIPVPAPAPGELLIRVTACGVCRTDLHIVDGDLPAHRLPLVPGHEIVGVVAESAEGFAVEPVDVVSPSVPASPPLQAASRRPAASIANARLIRAIRSGAACVPRPKRSSRASPLSGVSCSARSSISRASKLR